MDELMLKHARAKHAEWEVYVTQAEQALERANRMSEYWASEVRRLEGETNDD